jgi:hypothetical protein
LRSRSTDKHCDCVVEIHGRDGSAMVCKEKQRLLEAYQSVAGKYSAALAELHQKMGTLSKPDYDALYQTTEELLQDVAAARIKLQAHVQDHGC